jgi:DNA-binding IclR family transcriptional regulator
LASQSPRLVDFVIASTGLPQQTLSTITDPSQLRVELEKVGREVCEEQEEGVRAKDAGARRQRMRSFGSSTSTPVTCRAATGGW